LSSAAVSAILDAILVAKEEGWLDRIKALFGKRHSIVVMGSTGVGKSQLIKSLSVEIGEAIKSFERTQFVERHKLNVGGTHFEFIEAPGDEYKADHRREAIRLASSKGSRLALNIVADGHHEYTHLTPSNAIDKDGHVSQDYLNEHRAIELRYLEDFCSNAVGLRGIQTVLTVISKADIWWDNSEEVLSRYRIGPYAEVIGAAGARHGVVGYSSVSHRLYGRGLLAQTFDDEVRQSLRTRFFSTLLQLASEG
jgi:hypothetical protein